MFGAAAEPGLLLEVATALGVETTKKDWRTMLKRAFQRYLRPLMAGEDR
jgi:hypothetical protein